MAKKKTKSKDINGVKSELLLHIICEVCEKAKLPGNEIVCVLQAAMTEVAFVTMPKEHTDENFEEIADILREQFLEGLKFYRDKEKENGNENDNENDNQE